MVRPGHGAQASLERVSLAIAQRLKQLWIPTLQIAWWGQYVCTPLNASLQPTGPVDSLLLPELLDSRCGVRLLQDLTRCFRSQ